MPNGHILLNTPIIPKTRRALRWTSPSYALSMRDVTYDPAEESTYECFGCGTEVTATASVQCPDCGMDMRNRRTPIE